MQISLVSECQLTLWLCNLWHKTCAHSFKNRDWFTQLPYWISAVRDEDNDTKFVFVEEFLRKLQYFNGFLKEGKSVIEKYALLIFCKFLQQFMCWEMKFSLLVIRNSNCLQWPIMAKHHTGLQKLSFSLSIYNLICSLALSFMVSFSVMIFFLQILFFPIFCVINQMQSQQILSSHFILIQVKLFVYFPM